MGFIRNRAEYAVLQELMQLIQDRRINTFELPESCLIITAGNPEQDSVGDYQVNTMNDALKDRFIWFDMEANHATWINWAVKNDIYNEIIEFISEFPETLSNPELGNDVTPTPRSWEKFSQILKIRQSDLGIEDNKKFLEEDKNFIYGIGKGIIGSAATASFQTFILESGNPIIKFEEIFNMEIDDATIEKMILNESNIRLSIVSLRVAKRLNELLSEKGGNTKYKEIQKRVSLFYTTIPKDVTGNVISVSMTDYPKLYGKLIGDKDISNNVISGIL